MINGRFWDGKKVFLTGHSGFKGSWLSLWLSIMGAKVAGYALTPPTTPSLFQLCKIDNEIDSIVGDIRDKNKLTKVLCDFAPEIVIHMAAQPIVRESYRDPVGTYETNILGTVYLLEAVRQCPTVRAVINVTSDKCYENKDWVWSYRECDSMGGYDPYSNSKACVELITSSYRDSFFNKNDYQNHGVALATARAGNVIGGGDWALDRLVPDCMRALLNNEKIVIRNPNAIRPWQHVLEPLNGYLLLAEKLYLHGPQFAEGWNFGSSDSDAWPVKSIVNEICTKWGNGAEYKIDQGVHPHEENYIKLDCSKAKTRLNWQPHWDLEKAIEQVIEWTQAYHAGRNSREVCIAQIREYEHSVPQLED